MNARLLLTWLAILTLTLTACGTLEVGVEQSPTPDSSPATVAALVTQNAQLSTQVATLTAPTLPSELGLLAYVQGGDIWGKALPYGEPRRLTTDGRNQEPRWSPSGRWLAFRKDEQVWTMQADGSGAHPLAGGVSIAAFAWAPDRDLLAYVSGDELYVVNADSGSPVKLVAASPSAPQRLGRIAWSPDGQWIAYERVEQQPKQSLISQGLWKVSADGEQLAELYASGAPEKGEAILAGWSLDGEHVFFWQGYILSASMLADGVALYSLPAGGGEPIKLVDTMLVYDDFRPSAAGRPVGRDGGWLSGYVD